jgi:hypothetical protein
VKGRIVRLTRPQPRSAASIAATSIFFASVRTVGEICQDTPHLSLHQPQALSSPPLPTIAFQ